MEQPRQAKYILALSISALVGLVSLVQLFKPVTQNYLITEENNHDQLALAAPSAASMEAKPNQPAPTNFRLTMSDGKIVMNWDPSQSTNTFIVSGYIVNDGHTSANVTGTTYTYPVTVTPGNTYCFTLKSFDGGGAFSEPTASVCMTVPEEIAPVACTSYVYSDWGACTNGTKTRTITSNIPVGCVSTGAVPPVTSQSCTIVSDTNTTPPVIQNGLPSGNLAVNTTSATLAVTTTENAICKYSTVANTPYSSMTGNFITTGNLVHSTALTGLLPNTSYNYYIRCTKGGSNVNTQDYVVNFTVLASSASNDTTRPTILNSTPAWGHLFPSDVEHTNISVVTSEDATCRYGQTSGTSYASMGTANTMVTTDSRTHSATVSGLSPGHYYQYFIRCQDGALNEILSAYQILFSVEMLIDDQDDQDNAGNYDNSYNNNYGNYNNCQFSWWNSTGCDNDFSYDFTTPGYSPPVDPYTPPAPPANFTPPVNSPLPPNFYLPSANNNTYRRPTVNTQRPPTTITRTTHNTSSDISAVLRSTRLVKNLKLNDQGPQVLLLQRTLNLLGYNIATVGSQSLGHETSIFDAATGQALLHYQTDHEKSGVVASGVADNITLLLLNSDINRILARADEKPATNSVSVGVSAPNLSPGQPILPAGSTRPLGKISTVIGGGVNSIVTFFTGLFK